MQTLTTPRGTTTTNTWNYANFAMGELTQTQTGGKQATTYTYYEPSGLTHTATVPQPGTVGGTTGVTYSYTYDSLGNLLTAKTPGNNATIVGGVDQGIITTYNYTTDGTYTQADAIGQPLTVTNNLGKIWHYRYDARGNTLSVADPLGNQVSQTYDLADQPLQTTYPATGQSGTGNSCTVNSYVYTGGPVISTFAFNESSTQIRQVIYGYGVDGETLSVSGSTEPATFTYDAAFRTTSVTDGNSHTTLYSYNTAGYLLSVSAPLVNGNYDAVQFTSYDNDGNPLTRVDGRGISTTLAYVDNESRLTGITYPSPYTSQNATIAYDSYGRTHSVTDGTAAKVYSYDDGNRTTDVQTTFTGLTAQNILYAYYNDGSRQDMTTPAGLFTYTYDAIGRMTGLTNANSEAFSWTYLDNNWLWTQHSVSATVATYTYNALGRPTELVNSQFTTGNVLSQFGGVIGSGNEMFYDGVGNRTSMTATLTGVSSYSGLTSYNYDTKDQLTQEQSARSGGYTNGFGYDTAGNPTTFRGVDPTGGLGYNSDNQNKANTYDGNGNPTTYKGTTLAFDAENRLTSFGTALTAGYSTDGLRAWKQNSSGVQTYFLYDGLMPVCELASSGNVSASNTFGINGLLSRHTTANGGSSTFYTFDPTGNVTQRVSSAGVVLASQMFDAFGVRSSTDNSTDPFSGYGAQSGYYTDSETGLQLCGHRYYDAATGRFLNRDPIGFSGGINVYNYVGNGPISHADPSGLLVDPFGGPAALGGLLEIMIPIEIIGEAGDELWKYRAGGPATGPLTGIGVGLGNAIGNWLYPPGYLGPFIPPSNGRKPKRPSSPDPDPAQPSLPGLGGDDPEPDPEPTTACQSDYDKASDECIKKARKLYPNDHNRQARYINECMKGKGFQVPGY